jgi:hypothetical protein
VLKSAGPEWQKEVMREWFFQHFEDPVESCPHESSEGGFQYIWGGPFDAKEVLWNEFGGDVSEEVIDDLVSQLEEQCLEWSGVPTGPDFDDYLIDAVRARWGWVIQLDGRRRHRRLQPPRQLEISRPAPAPLGLEGS